MLWAWKLSMNSFRYCGHRATIARCFVPLDPMALECGHRMHDSSLCITYPHLLLASACSHCYVTLALLRQAPLISISHCILLKYLNHNFWHLFRWNLFVWSDLSSGRQLRHVMSFVPWWMPVTSIVPKSTLLLVPTVFGRIPIPMIRTWTSVSESV